MKRIFALIVCTVTACSLVACSAHDYGALLENDDYSSITSQFEEYAATSYQEDMNKEYSEQTPRTVYDEIKFVTMTLPGNYVNTDRTQDDWNNIAVKMGCESILLNADGSVTYKMPEAEYQAWMDEVSQYVKAGIISSSTNLKISKYSGNVNNKTTSDFSTINIITTEKEYDLESGYDVYDLIQLGKIYNVYNNSSDKEIRIIFSYLEDSKYQAYLNALNVYQDALNAYNDAWIQYEADKKTYENEKKTYASIKTEYDNSMSDYKNRKNKYSGRVEANWSEGYGGDYYLYDKDGEMIYRAWVKDGKDWYLIDDYGCLVRNDLKYIDGCNYVFGDGGELISGDNDKFELGTGTALNDGLMTIIPIEPEKPVEPVQPTKPTEVEPIEPDKPNAEDFYSITSTQILGRR